MWLTWGQKYRKYHRHRVIVLRLRHDRRDDVVVDDDASGQHQYHLGFFLAGGRVRIGTDLCLGTPGAFDTPRFVVHSWGFNPKPKKPMTSKSTAKRHTLDKTISSPSTNPSQNVGGIPVLTMAVTEEACLIAFQQPSGKPCVRSATSQCWLSVFIDDNGQSSYWVVAGIDEPYQVGAESADAHLEHATFDPIEGATIRGT